MITSELQDLLNEAACYGCYGLSQAEMITLAIERRWLLALDPAADTTAVGILSNSEGLAGYGLSLFDLFEVGMLIAIKNAL